MQHVKRTSGGVFSHCLLRQAAYLGAPVVNTTGTGIFSSAVPSPKVSLAAYVLMRPDFWKYIWQVDTVRVEAGYFNETYIADAAGRVLQRVPPEVEAYALAEVVVADTPPQPHGKQPPFGISVFAYLLDAFANAALPKIYRRGIRNALGISVA